MTPLPLVASRRHTAIFFAIAAGVTLLAMAQAPQAGDAPAVATSRVLLYLVLIAVQILWLRFVRGGVRKQGGSLTAFTGGWWTSAREALGDVAFGAIGYAAAHAAVAALQWQLGDPDANVSFLLPHGAAESLLWVLVSVTAGVVEEIVFRGYLQRQLAALLRNVPLAILLQALVFGVMHGYQGPRSIAVTGAYGLVLGVLAWWRGNVRACALAHAATDIVGGLS